MAALWDAFDVTYVSSAQSYAKLYLVHLVSGPVRKSVSSVGGDVGGLHDIDFGWC